MGRTIKILGLFAGLEQIPDTHPLSTRRSDDDRCGYESGTLGLGGDQGFQMRSLCSSLILLMVAFSPAVVAQSVYKCQGDDGSMVFSDMPCDEQASEVVDITPHQGHRISNPRSPYDIEIREMQSARFEDSSAPEAGAEYGEYKSSSDEADSSLRRGPGNSDFYRIEALERERNLVLANLRKRHLEREKRAQYSAELERIDSDLVDLRGGQEPVLSYHDEVYERQREFELLEAERQKRRQGVFSAPDQPPPGPAIISSCDTGGCWGTDGRRYNHASNENFFRQDGRFCRRVGNQMQCN